MRTEFAPAYRHSAMPTYQEVVAGDPTPAPDVVHEYSETEIPIGQVKRSEYFSDEFARKELDLMWPRVWQFACREEQIPEPGDLVVYDGPGASFLIVRTPSGAVRAFYNSCRHRGMRLCDRNTSVAKLACPFHGWTWTLDGELSRVPARWDFDRFEDAEMRLPEARAECWNGFVFINRSHDAPPLERYLGHLVPHFADWPLGDRQLSAIVRKTVKANWKTCMDAFVEVYHIAGLHPQALPFAGDVSTQYDIWPDDPHASRFLNAGGVPSDNLPNPMSEQQMLAAMLGMHESAAAEVLTEGVKARGVMANASRQALSTAHARDYAALADAEIVDGHQYSLFPNFFVFRSLNFPYFYRFLPLRDNPSACTFEVFVLGDNRSEDGSPDVETIELGDEDTFVSSSTMPELFAEILDQDVWGMQQCQIGLRDGGDADLILSRYQEARIRHLHQTLNGYLDGTL